MHRSCRFSTFLAFAALSLGVAMLGAQSADDLPAAPSEAIKPKPAPKKADPPPQPDPTQPAQSPNGSPQPDGRPTASSKAPDGNVADEPVLSSNETIRKIVNEVRVV